MKPETFKHKTVKEFFTEKGYSEFFMDYYWYTNSAKDYYLCKVANNFFRIVRLSYNQVEYSQEERKIRIKDERINEESRHLYYNFNIAL